MPELKVGRFRVAKTMLDQIRLPVGYNEIWSRRTSPDYVELLVHGPFPDPVQDGEMVGAQVSLVDSDIVWQWLDRSGAAVGDPILL